MMTTDVLALMAQIGDGRLTVEQATPRLQELLVPCTVRVSPAGDATALLEAEQDDSPPPYTPDSWDDVYRAYIAYDLIDDEQYAALHALVDVPPARKLVWETSHSASERGRWILAPT